MKKPYQPNPKFTELLPDTSGNTINGLDEPDVRQASPFFWHPPDQQTHGALQRAVTDELQSSPEVATHFSPSAPGGGRSEPWPDD